MKPNWSVANEILKRVQKEANLDWSKSISPELPKSEPINILKDNVGMWNIIRQALQELKP